MLAVYKREILGFLNSLIGYLVIGIFLTLTGLFMWVFPETNILSFGYSNLDPLFYSGPYVFLFLIPAITMRTFSEEKKSGTIEFLLTRPLSEMQIILAKYMACLTLLLIALVPTVVYYFSVSYLGYPVGNVDSAAVLGSYIGLFLLGALFTSLGLFASSITENQIVAFIVSAFLCFLFFYGFESLAQVDVWGGFSTIIEKLGVAYHYSSLSKGLIDTRDLIYFLSLITFSLFATNLVFRSRKW